MSSPSLLEQVEDYSHPNCSDGKRSAPSRSTATANGSSASVNETGASRDSKSRATSADLTEGRGAAKSTSSLEGSPAKTSRAQRRAKLADKDLPASVAAFGSKCFASFESVGLRTSGSKT